MDRFLLGNKWLWLWLIFGFACSFNCSSKSNYQQAVSICFPDGIPQKIPMLATCKSHLEQLVAFGPGFDQEGGDEQKQHVIDALYFMLSYPLSFPMDQVVDGVAPASQILSQDLRIMHEEHPDFPVNQLFFDYLINQVRVLKLISEDKPYGAFYIPLDQSINLVRLPNFAFTNKLYLAGTLHHESRHARYWDHPIYCPELDTNANACDEGSNQPYGWEFSFYWALLQGHKQNPLTTTEIQAIGCSLYPITRHIYGFPAVWQSIRGPVYNERTYQNFPTLQQMATQENLTLPKARDYYQEVLPFCPLSEAYASLACKQKLSELIPISILPDNPHAVEQKEAILQALYIFLKYPITFSERAPLFQAIPRSDLFPSAMQKLLDDHPTQIPNQVFFNYTISAIDKISLGNLYPPDHRTYYDFCNRTFLFNEQTQSYPYSAFDLLAKLIESARQSEVWPESESDCHDKLGPKASYCEKGIDGAYGFSINYLWALLQNSSSVFSQELANYIYKQICYKSKALIDLPAALAPLRSVDCGKVDYAFDTGANQNNTGNTK